MRGVKEDWLTKLLYLSLTNLHGEGQILSLRSAASVPGVEC